MESSFSTGPGTDTIFAIKRPDGIIMVFTGRTIDCDVTVSQETLDLTVEELMYPVTVKPVGSARLQVHLDMHLTYQGQDMKTWADIRQPAGEIENRRAIE